MTETEIKVHEKKEMQHRDETTKPERHFVPAVDIYESGEAVTVIADMPGVACDQVDVNLEDGVLILKGTMAGENLAGHRVLLREYETGCYLRRFTISEVIDQNKIEAIMADGVLRIMLPKLQPAKPRKIEIQTG